MIKIYFCSTKRRETLKEFQEFVGSEQECLLKHCPTRWLSLKRCVDRIIKQFQALKSYFGAQTDADKPMTKIYHINQQLNDPCLLPWLHFVSSYLKPYYDFNTKFQVS